MVQTDRSSNRHHGEVEEVRQSLKGDVIECVVCLRFPTTNNNAEYEALLTGLDLAKAA